MLRIRLIAGGRSADLQAVDGKLQDKLLLQMQTVVCKYIEREGEYARSRQAASGSPNHRPALLPCGEGSNPGHGAGLAEGGGQHPNRRVLDTSFTGMVAVCTGRRECASIHAFRFEFGNGFWKMRNVQISVLATSAMQATQPAGGARACRWFPSFHRTHI